MINNRKTIAVFINQVTTGYRRPFCETINSTAVSLGYNVVFINFMGIIGGKHRDYGDYEYKFIDVIPYDQFAGIIFDEESFTIDGMVEKLVAKIKEKAKCPVISGSSYMEDFYNIVFDDASGIELMVQHLYDVHGCRQIGFMSGPFKHPDAAARLAAFKVRKADTSISGELLEAKWFSIDEAIDTVREGSIIQRFIKAAKEKI